MGASGARPTTIVVGNEKGGSGKSTTAIHIAIALLYRGFAVGALDLDSRQATLTRYLDNRRRYHETTRPVPMPRYARLDPPAAGGEDDRRAAAGAAIEEGIAAMGALDVVILDTPGGLTTLSRVGHERADILITPVNDSLLDIDVLADIDVGQRRILAPSFYCRMAWEYNNRRVIEGLPEIDWVVACNRLAHVHSHNRQAVDQILEKLSQRVGFRLVAGLSERVVFRELFSTGLTVLDLPGTDENTITASRQAAVAELTALVDALDLVRPAERPASTAGALTGE